MFILNDILTPLRDAFSSTNLGRERAHWFSCAILTFIIPFTSSISSNVLRCLNTLFGLNLNKLTEGPIRSVGDESAWRGIFGGKGRGHRT